MNYYTPTIEEFYVGFEYEMDAGTGWTKQIFPNPWWKDTGMGGLPTLVRCIDDRIIRVKCLNHEDIKSFGWQETKERVNLKGCDEFKTVGKRDTFYLWKASEMYGPNQWVIERRQSNNYFTCFSGAIKNKSELKKIMQMIGIEAK